MIVFRVQLRVSPAVRDRAVKSLLRLVGPTRTVKGCTACGTYVDVEDGNTLVYVEEWETQDDLDQRLRTGDVRVLLSVLDLASEPPCVHFHTINRTRGMEVIVAARTKAEGGA